MRVFGEPMRFSDGTALSVETCDGLVRLVTLDAEASRVRGIVLAPLEAQRLGQHVLAAAFAANRRGGCQE